MIGPKNGGRSVPNWYSLFDHLRRILSMYIHIKVNLALLDLPSINCWRACKKV